MPCKAFDHAPPLQTLIGTMIMQVTVVNSRHIDILGSIFQPRVQLHLLFSHTSQLRHVAPQLSILDKSWIDVTFA